MSGSRHAAHGPAEAGPVTASSIYGMNFEHMPELEWLLGYPWALALMVLSAVLPYWWFKHRGWL